MKMYTIEEMFDSSSYKVRLRIDLCRNAEYLNKFHAKNEYFMCVIYFYLVSITVLCNGPACHSLLVGSSSHCTFRSLNVLHYLYLSPDRFWYFKLLICLSAYLFRFFAFNRGFWK